MDRDMCPINAANGSENSVGYYDQFADELEELYESIDFERVHGEIVDLIPVGGRVLDVGAGTGRDAEAIARRAEYVCAVEPSRELLRRAIARHEHPNIRWVSDSLPRLEKIRDEDKFDLILLSSVWMHIEPDDEELARERLCEMLVDGGVLVLTSRSPGPDIPGVIEKSEDHIRRTFEKGDMICTRRSLSKDEFYREGIEWLALVFERGQVSSRGRVVAS